MTNPQEVEAKVEEIKKELNNMKGFVKKVFTSLYKQNLKLVNDITNSP